MQQLQLSCKHGHLITMFHPKAELECVEVLGSSGELDQCMPYSMEVEETDPTRRSMLVPYI
tara:strand:+ start:583 stop:765 length:183 start_codon:yes stop_codon:yes gene_type:complete